MKLDYDYTDLVKTGALSPSEVEKTGERIYAVLIKTASGNIIPKFDITDKDAVRESITAINMNKHIPDNVRKSAEYFTKLAAENFKIDVQWKVSKSPHVVGIEYTPKVEVSHVDVIKVAGCSIPLDSNDNIKEASELLISNHLRHGMVDTIQMSKLIVKAAEAIDSDVHPDIKAYANNKIGTMFNPLIELRKQASQFDEDTLNALNVISSNIEKIAAPIAIAKIKELDHSSGYSPNNGINYSSFFKDVPEIRKIAEQKESLEEKLS